MVMSNSRSVICFRAVGKLAIALAIVFVAAGCDDPSLAIRQLHKEVDTLKGDVARLSQELEDRDARIASLRRRIETGDHLSGITLVDLFLVDRIQLVSRSGGADYDGQPGDDGVTVYVRPLDKAGDVIKAAGQVTIQLTDLTVPGSPVELGVYVYDNPEVLGKKWYGGMLTDHYTFECPFKPEARFNRARELNVRVTFLDWLTGEEFTASTTVEIDRVDAENALVPQ